MYCLPTILKIDCLIYSLIQQAIFSVPAWFMHCASKYCRDKLDLIVEAHYT